ncbi:MULTISPECIES: flagellar biosynthesis protein FliQ [unclassified Hydrogenophaga]|jgi:flagellar biosynthesis protein FliQ|uniref:flagellar biosynthesis protein FliQ n=1 Tax=unclassified Hydrogenophaga TaxID=2610897 RepID=UPI0025C39CCC|nr:flagellar biosynthesis protein FliQ [Hydrogenophaga sp.]MBU7572443.1 flagellar biosynthesis protein FliQ [Hydrogenophaga sp.]MCW5671236.1 flagellar biosynthesis protein FliQ [Hydrogenophaga sp.]
MTPEIAVELVAECLKLVVVLVTLLIGPSLVVGVVVSLFQAATQINEQTLSFLPRLIVTLLAIIFMGQWLASKLMDYCIAIFERAAQLAI